MFKKWANKRGYRNIFDFILGKHSPPLIIYRAMDEARKELNKEAKNIEIKRRNAKEPKIKWYSVK